MLISPAGPFPFINGSSSFPQQSAGYGFKRESVHDLAMGLQSDLVRIRGERLSVNSSTVHGTSKTSHLAWQDEETKARKHSQKK